MTVSAAIPPADAAPPRSPSVGRPASRSFLRRALGDTFARYGARLGLAWISIVAFFAVFAPFVANSHPYFLLEAGHAAFPLFRFLTYADLVALSVALAVVLTFVAFRRAAPRVRALVFVATIAAGALLAMFHETPLLSTYELYREGEANGTMTHVIRAPLPYSPRDRLRDKAELWDSRPPSASHWFGTTPNREDVLSAMMHACRIAILIGFISTGIAVAIGCTIGGLMGYFAGRVDLVGMRLIEIFESIPQLFLLITFVSFYGRNIYLIMAIIGLVGWTVNARFIRGQFLQLREQDYIHAARAMGVPLWSILLRHMLPNGISPVLVSASFGVASAILSEATLSFLGLGLIDEPSWGVMLNQARGVGTTFNWWLAVFPGAAIFLTVFAYNLIGEAFRDALDPKLKQRE